MQTRPTRQLGRSGLHTTALAFGGNALERCERDGGQARIIRHA